MADVVIDPALTHLLRKAGEAETISASFVLRRDRKLGALKPQQTDALVELILRRVKSRLHAECVSVRVHRNLGTFSVTAPAKFIAGVTNDPGIASALAEHAADEIAIHPLDPPKRIRRKSR